MSFETISVIGLGYIGLPTAAVLASRKVQVVGVDVSQHAVDMINHGKIHIVEPELDIVVSSAVAAGYLRATIIPEPSDAFLIAVPTPFKDDHEPDLSFIKSAVKSIVPVLKKGDLVVLESTSPVGATEMVATWMAEARADLSFPQNAGEDADVNVAHCPERVLPGHIIRELVQNDRVIGGMSRKCAARSIELYKIFVDGDCIITDCRTAEMTKLTENSFRDVNIAFANELSMICDRFSINVWELISLANRHPRVNILQPGPGVGGHCVAVDPWFIIDSAPEEAKLIRTAREVNDGKPDWVIKKVIDAVEGIRKPVVACLGLSFKANIGDLRESPALQIVQRLVTSVKAEYLIVEPNIHELPNFLVTQKNTCLTSLEKAVKDADVIVLLVDHSEFLSINKQHLNEKTVIDTRGAWK